MTTETFIPHRQGPLGGLRIRVSLYQLRSELETEDQLLAQAEFENIYPGQRLQLPLAVTKVAPLRLLYFEIEILTGDGTRIRDAIMWNRYRAHPERPRITAAANG